ncbi:hypothetical protein F5Y13DRAFT_204988 [Hypoxylon sp. FL1857]|nr:hypothetical protein F5Y13DRAFT_204988 [Hypoxylon sp. FL1857]
MASPDVQLPTTAPTFVAGGLSTAPTASSPIDVDTTLNYFKDAEDGSPPKPTYVDKPETYERPVVSHPVHITDVRGRESEFTLDGHGFQYVPHVAQEKDFADDEHIKAVYYPETEQLLKDVTGASKIFIFDHTIRREPADKRATTDQSKAPLRGPVNRVHIDQTYSAALSRVPHHLPAEEASELLKGRVQIINVWRPIRTVLRDP